MRACVALGRLGALAAAPTVVRDHLPPDARLLVVGASAVGKTSISRALQRYARKVRMAVTACKPLTP